ncbi:hypothetical protein LI328DRAFT_122257 [Trichoderma asperelloides]|nr:hypothetical protein LI328DRAFT_122257 [Trichoderma asperelloides]
MRIPRSIASQTRNGCVASSFVTSSRARFSFPPAPSNHCQPLSASYSGCCSTNKESHHYCVLRLISRHMQHAPSGTCTCLGLLFGTLWSRAEPHGV